MRLQLKADVKAVLEVTPAGVLTPDDVDSVLLPDNPGTVWSVEFTPDQNHVAAAVEDELELDEAMA